MFQDARPPAAPPVGSGWTQTSQRPEGNLGAPATHRPLLNGEHGCSVPPASPQPLGSHGRTSEVMVRWKVVTDAFTEASSSPVSAAP